MQVLVKLQCFIVFHVFFDLLSVARGHKLFRSYERRIPRSEHSLECRDNTDI